MDATGRTVGDIGYDPNTEQGYSKSALDESGRMSGDRGYSRDGRFSIMGIRPEKKLGRAEQWRLDHPPEPMAPVDFSNAPSWWNKGSEQQAPTTPMLPQTPAPATPQLPAYSPQPSGGGGGRMIDYLGNAGGRTGIVATSPLSAALRGATGGQTNGQ